MALLLGRLPLLSLLPLLPLLLPLLLARPSRRSALLPELLVGLRSPVAALLATRWRPLGRRVSTLLGWLLARGITPALLSRRFLLGRRLPPSPAVLATLLAVLSLSVLGAAVLPSHGSRPVGRTPSSE